MPGRLPLVAGNKRHTYIQNILSTVDFSKNCSWFGVFLHDYLHPNGNWLIAVTLEATWKSVLPANLYNSSLIYCYDLEYRVFTGSRTGWDFGGQYLYQTRTLPACCSHSVDATGDPDLGGIGVSIQTSSTSKCRGSG